MEEQREETIVYQDSRIKIILDERETEGYIAILDGKNIVYFPRGTLRDVATMDREQARGALEQLEFRGIDGDLTQDSLIAAATKAHYEDEEIIRKATQSER